MDDLFLNPRPPFPTSRALFDEDLARFIDTRGRLDGLRHQDDYANAFSIDTLIGQSIATFDLTRRFKAADIDLTPIRGFNPFEDADLGNYPIHIFSNARSPGEVEYEKALYDENNLLRENLSQSESFLPRLLANFSDPINIIPTPFVRAATFAKGFKQTGTTAFAAFAPFEIARANIDPTSTAAESVLAIGGSTIIAGLLGGTVAKMGARNLDAISNSYFAGHAVVDAANELQTLHPNAVEAILPRKPGAPLRDWVKMRERETVREYEARLKEIEADETTYQRYAWISDSYAEGSELIETGTRIEKWRTLQHPWLFLKNTKFGGILGNRIRRLADEISGSPGMYTKGNLGDTPTAHSAHVRALLHNVALVNFHRAQVGGFLRSEGFSIDDVANQSEIGAAFGALGRSLPGVKAGKRQAEFDEDVSNYYMNPLPDYSTIIHIDGKHANYAQSVVEAAEGIKEYMKVIGKQGIEVGLFGEGRSKLKIHNLELRLKDVKARGKQPTETMNEHLDEINFIANQIDAEKLNIKKLRVIAKESEAKTGNPFPRVKNDPSLGHWPMIWKAHEVEARRSELAEILERYFVKEGDVQSRLEETIGRILGQGEFSRFVPVLRKIMEDAGMEKTSIKQWIDDFETIVKEAKIRAPHKADLQVEVKQALTPFFKKFLFDVGGEKVDEATIDGLGTLKNSIDDTLKEELSDNLKVIAEVLEDIEDIIADGSSGNFGTSVNALARKINIPPHLVRDFIETEPSKVMRLYHRRMAVSIEMARRFDSDPSMTTEIYALSRLMDDQIGAATGKARLELIKEKEDTISAIEDLRDKVLGVYRIPRDPSALDYRATQFTKHWMALSLMGQPIIASLADLGKIQMALGWKQMFGAAFKAATASRHAFKTKLGPEAKVAGIGSDLATRYRFEQLMDFDQLYTPLNKAEEFTARNVDRLFFVNMLTPYTDFLKVFTGSVMQSNIIQTAEKVATGKRLSRTENLWINRAGLGKDDLKDIYAQWQKSGAQKEDVFYLANTTKWTDETLKRKFRTALATEVENAVITPGPSTRFNFMSTNLGGIATQFKNFSITATHQILLAGLQQRDMYTLQAITSMIAIGAFVDMWKSPDYDTRDLLSIDRLVQAIDYAGVTGIMFDLNNMTEVISGHNIGLRPLLGVDPIWKNPTIAQRGGQVFGPAGSLGFDFIWSLTSPDAEANDVARSIRRLTPYNNLIWWDGVVDIAQRQVGQAFTATEN